MTKKFKSPEEWKNIIGKLDEKDFEHLCYQLVNAMSGFVNADLRNGSYDGGRDIEAIFKKIAPDGITEMPERWRFECKKYSKGVSFDKVSGKINRTNLDKVNTLVIMSNMSLTPPCKDEIDKIKDTLNCEIIDWTGVHFQDILFQYPDICKEFFPDEEITQRFLDKKPKELLGIAQKAGSHFGIEIEIKLKKGRKLPINIEETADIIRENLLNLENIDLNIKSLIYQQISGFFLSINRKDDALLFIDESLKITPKNIATLLNKGFILDKLDELEGSAKYYNEVLKIDKYNKFALNNKAHNLRRKGKLKEALDLVNKALDIDPDFTVAIHNKTSILSNLGKTEEALEFLGIKLKKRQDSRILLESKVNLLIDLLDLKEAMKVNEQVLEIDPENISAINNKGVIYEHNSKYQKPEKYLLLATEWFEKVINMDKNYHLGWSNKIICLVNNGSLDDAEKIVDSVIDVFPTNSYILNEKGRILLKKGDSKKALKFFNKALKYNVLSKILINKADAQLALRKNKEAKETTERILKHDPKNFNGWLLKGKALRNLHKITLANRCFKKAERYKKVPRSLLE